MDNYMPNAKITLAAFALVWLLLSASCDGCRETINADNPTIPNNNNYPIHPPSVLPAATQTGVGTLGCKINGRVWTFWIPPFALTSETGAQLSESNGLGTANIWARIWSSDTFVDQIRVHHDIGFSFLNPFFEPKTFVKAGGGTINTDMFSFYLLIDNQSKWYFPDTSLMVSTNRLIIDQIDTNTNIISGRFDLILYRGHDHSIIDRSDSLMLSEGRFDFKYVQQ